MTNFVPDTITCTMSVSITGMANMLSLGTSNGTYHNITCSEQFFLEESSELCKPECGVWTQHSPKRATGIHYSLIATVVLGILLCLAVLLLSLFQRKTM